MNLELKNDLSYSQCIGKLSFYTVISVIGCILLGYIFLPFAAAYYAALLTYESKGRRVLSIAIPAVMFTVNFLLRAALSLEGVAYVVVGLLIYFAVKRGWSKSETGVWIVIVTVVMILLSAILLAFEKTGSIGLLPLKQFYSNIFYNLKAKTISDLTSLTTQALDGSLVFVCNPFKAEKLFNELMISMLPFLFIIAFLLTGIAFKIYSGFAINYSREGSGIADWRFGASNVVCYFYIILALIALVAPNDGSIFAYTIITLNSIFSVVFAYLGCRFVYNLFTSGGRSRLFAIIVIVLAFIMFSSYAVAVLSYVGTATAIYNNKSIKASK